MSRKSIAPLVLLLILSCHGLPAAAQCIFVDDLADGAIGSGTAEDPFRDLQNAINSAPDRSSIVVLPGRYEAAPHNLVEAIAGNTLEPATEVPFAAGFVIRGKSLEIHGASPGETVLVTNAGYGVYVVDCPRARISNLTITGGIRDESGDACDAAVVMRRSFAEIDHCQLRDNTQYIEENIVGVGGVFVRDGGCAHIPHNAIVNNTWDGVALYRGASAVVHDNFIYGGRGAGIGITWDATAHLYRNIIAEYWKGIGSFGESMVSVENCIVTDCLGWGIIATGESRMDAVNNTVVRMGNVGLAGWSPAAQMKLVNNISFANGWRQQWVAPRVGVWMNIQAGNFTLLNNCAWGNEEGNYLEVTDPTGTFGNISEDPLFVTGKLNLPEDATPENTRFASIPDDLFQRTGGGYRLQAASPCIGAGYGGYLNADATPSDLGAFGGWFAPMAPNAE